MARRNRSPATHSWVQRALGALRSAGHRTSGARESVIELLGRQDCCLSAQEIYDELRDGQRPVGLATVYRVLDLLGDLRLVQRVDVGGTTAKYEPVLPGGHHHHHVVCDDCGRVAAFTDERLERAVEGVAGRVGFAVDAHEVVLRGACDDCRLPA